jgi:hypothetical protein
MSSMQVVNSCRETTEMRRFVGCGLLLWLLLLALPLTEPRCAEVEVTSRWSAAGIKVDGLRGDWPNGAVGFLKDPEASVGVCNDSQNLYVVLAFRNEDWARVVRMSGLTLWLDNQGKKKKEFMLKFTSGPGRDQMKGGNPPDSATVMRQRPDMESETGGMPGGRKAETTLVCYQKDRIAEKQIPLSGGEGPAAAFALDQGMYVYEFKIPLHESEVRNYGVAPISGKPFSIGLIWGEMDRTKMRRPEGGGGMGGDMGGGFPGGGPGGGGPGGGMGGGMGGGPGGGGPGGSGGGPMGQRRGSEKQELWLKAKLVTSSGETSTKK